MAVSVRFHRLCKRFGPTVAVDDVDLLIEPGELFFLLGPSGCGKTTILRTLAGFYEPDSGSVFIGEEDVTRRPPYARDTGMVFQSYALWPHLTVRENVAFGLEMRRVPRAEAARRVGGALELVHMADRADHKPNQLSGGQQQRVALARALVIRPKCLLLDEPLSNLDAKLRLEMRAEIRRICKESDLTAVYVTHDQKEALSIADRLAVLNRGRIEQLGRPQDVYRRPRNRFVANFIGETNFVAGRVASSRGGRTVVQTVLGRVESRAPADGSLGEGREVSLSLRPEVVRLGDPPAGAPNVFDGVVHHTVYLGEIAQHQVRLEPAPGVEGAPVELKVCEMNPKIVARDTREAARVLFAPEDVTVLDD